jgi:hypothetical protein
MEFLRVNFEGSSRGVLLNGNPGGRTNSVITIPLPGTYKVSLEGPPNDFTPSVQEIQLILTSAFQPMQLTFHRLPPSVSHP